MAKVNISQLLLSSPEYLIAKQNFREASHAAVNSCKLTVMSKLGSAEITIPKPFNPDKDLIYLNMLKDAKKKAKNEKSVESGQREMIESSLNNIHNQLETKRMLQKKVHWVKQMEDFKTEEVSQNVKKLMHEQTERQKKVQDTLQKEKKERLEQLEKLKSEENLQKIKKLEEEKLKKIIETREKAEERKKYMEGLKELKKVKKQKWLYEKLAEDFEETVVKQENDRIAEAIASKHREPVPSLEDLQDHIKSYKQSKENRSALRSSVDYSDIRKFPHSKFLKNLLEEEQMAKEMEKIREAEKVDLLDRKKNYANLVRQLYQPSMKDLKPSKPKTNQTPTKRRVMSLTPTLKRPENSTKVSSPKVPRPRELPKIDYLETRRIMHEKDAQHILLNYNSFDITTLKQAKKAEDQIKRAEIAVKGLKPGVFNLEAEEKMTKVLIDSIKVKLDAINKG